jgi:hypothetical protein
MSLLFPNIVARKKQQVVDHYLWLAKQTTIAECDYPDAGGLTPTDLFILASSVESCSAEEFATYMSGTNLIEGA